MFNYCTPPSILSIGSFYQHCFYDLFIFTFRGTLRYFWLSFSNGICLISLKNASLFGELWIRLIFGLVAPDAVFIRYAF